MLFKCPVCGEKHIVNDRCDNKDYICPNTSGRINQKTFQNLTPTDILSRPGYNYNKSSTKIDEARPATIIVGGKPDYRRSGEKVGTLKRNY